MFHAREDSSLLCKSTIAAQPVDDGCGDSGTAGNVVVAATTSTTITRETSNSNEHKVRFDESNNDTVIDASHELLEQDHSILWYQNHELAFFRQEAQEIVHKATTTTTSESLSLLPTFNAATNQIGNNGNIIIGNNNIIPIHRHEKRGLERFEPDRSTQKNMAIQYTLLACERGLDQDSIRRVSEKCSSWALEQAITQASHDYIHVYKPSLIPTLKPTTTPPSLVHMRRQKRKKRSSVTSTSATTLSSTTTTTTASSTTTHMLPQEPNGKRPRRCTL